MGSVPGQPHMIDAMFLLQKFPFVFGQIKDPSPLSVLSGKCPVNILGYVEDLLQYTVYNMEDGSEGRLSPISTRRPQKVLVVESLPTPFHFSGADGFPPLRINHFPQFTAEALPAPYDNHQFWFSDRIFLPL